MNKQKHLRKILLFGVLALGVMIFSLSIDWTPASAVIPAPSPHDVCVNVSGGVWSGATSYSTGGECDLGKVASSTCPSGFGTHIATYNGGVYFPITGSGWDDSIRCYAQTGPGYGKCGNEAGKTDEPVTVDTCHGTSVLFAAGACAGKCTVGPQVLATAKKGFSQLDGDVIGQAYVKLRNPGGGSYKICMPGEGTIYKWISGAWVAQATQTVNGVSCGWSSGDGNYVLVSP